MRGTSIATLLLLMFLVHAGPTHAQQPDVLENSPIIDLITAYLRAYPDASGEQVAAFANASLAEYGIDYDATYTADSPPKELALEAGSHRFVARVPDVPESSPCGEYHLTIPAVHADDETIDVVYDQHSYSVHRPETLLLDEMIVYAPDQRTIISRFVVPWQKEPPDAVLPDGSGVLFIVGLGRYRHVGPSGAAVAREDVSGPYPTLLLQVSASGLKFIGDARLYDSGEPVAEIKEWPGAPEFHARERRRFEHSGLVVEFPGPGPACT